MPRYVDGFLLPLPTRNLKTYRRIAGNAGKIWRQHGALEYRECVLEDPKTAPMLTFPAVAKVKKGETVILAWIVYKSRAHRDRVNKLVMADPRLTRFFDPKKPPFDCKRMAYGGFTVLVQR
jgi:uncharacterized protein YbaA (DUF1428 family)